MRILFAWCLLVLAALPASSAENTTFLLNGTVVAPDRVISNGWVAIENGKITAVSATKPTLAGARELVTKDIIFPGFVDLHNHPFYAVFPRWTPPQIFANRYQWRGLAEYNTTIQTPEGKLVEKNFCDIDAYVELKALMGGTTSILGVFQPADAPKIEPCIAGLARNLDWASGFHGAPLGQERAVNVLGVKPFDQKLSEGAMAQFRTGNLDLAAVHLAEGQRNDPETKAEFAMFESLGLLGSKSAVIHGVALGEPEFTKMAAAGTSFIWSPRSNVVLYGETADVAAALRQKVQVALAPDWSPTGSVNMLGEVGYARTVADRQFKGLISGKRLFEMATVVPARIAKIDDKVGSLKPGLYADLFLLRSAGGDAYEALAKAQPQDVTLTMVGGVPLYGSKAHMTALGLTAAEAVKVCAADMAVNGPAMGQGGLAGVAARLATALAGEKATLAGLAECP